MSEKLCSETLLATENQKNCFRMSLKLLARLGVNCCSLQNIVDNFNWDNAELSFQIAKNPLSIDRVDHEKAKTKAKRRDDIWEEGSKATCQCQYMEYRPHQ